MSTGSILLRIVLCLGLILDGAQTAVAATQMQLTHAAHTKASPMQAMQTRNVRLAMHEIVPACHEHSGIAAMSHPIAATTVHQTTQSKHPVPDCCKSGHCSCACTQQIAVVVAWFAMPHAAIIHDNAVRAMATAHPSPALPHLIRPPIG